MTNDQELRCKALEGALAIAPSAIPSTTVDGIVNIARAFYAFLAEE